MGIRMLKPKTNVTTLIFTIQRVSDAVLLKSFQVRLNAEFRTCEVLNQPSNGVFFGVESNDAGSESNFFVDAWVLLVDGELRVLFGCEGDELMMGAH